MLFNKKSVELSTYTILIDAYNKQEVFDNLSREDKLLVIINISNEYYFNTDEHSKHIMSFFYKEENIDVMSDYVHGVFYL